MLFYRAASRLAGDTVFTNGSVEIYEVAMLLAFFLGFGGLVSMSAVHITCITSLHVVPLQRHPGRTSALSSYSAHFLAVSVSTGFGGRQGSGCPGEPEQ